MQTFLRYFIGLVWLVNGLFCKVLNLVPRHRQIVAAILGEKYAAFFTIAIGVSETMMFVWIISKLYSRLCTWVQVIIIATMNLVEFIAVPQLLLFGKFNIVVASGLIAIILYHQYSIFNDKTVLEK